MTLRFSDALFDYFEVEIDPGVTRLCYYCLLYTSARTCRTGSSPSTAWMPPGVPATSNSAMAASRVRAI